MEFPATGKSVEHYPERDVSYQIFYALEKALVKNRFLLDKKIFNDMAVFYAGKQGQVQSSAEEKLLQRFGQQKLYALTKDAADMLTQPTSKWQSFKRFFVGYTAKEKIIRKVSKEAHAELLLQNHTEGYFFGIRQFFVRCWHRTLSNRTGLVKLCEDLSLYDLNDKKISRVNSPDFYTESRVTPPSAKPIQSAPLPSKVGVFAKSTGSQANQITQTQNGSTPAMGFV